MSGRPLQLLVERQTASSSLSNRAPLNSWNSGPHLHGADVDSLDTLSANHGEGQRALFSRDSPQILVKYPWNCKTKQERVRAHAASSVYFSISFSAGIRYITDKEIGFQK